MSAPLASERKRRLGRMSPGAADRKRFRALVFHIESGGCVRASGCGVAYVSGLHCKVAQGKSAKRLHMSSVSGVFQRGSSVIKKITVASRTRVPIGTVTSLDPCVREVTRDW
jgi:hypothetical protein